jgi:hypothetical protein
MDVDLRAGSVASDLFERHAPLLDNQLRLVPVRSELDFDDVLTGLIRSLVVSWSLVGRSHTSTRPVPSQPLAKKRAEPL